MNDRNVDEVVLKTSASGRLEITGNLSFQSVPGLWSKHAGQIASCETMDIDLAGVSRSDSAGLAFLVECLRLAHSAGKPVRFFNTPQQMLDIAQVSGLDTLLPLHDD